MHTLANLAKMAAIVVLPVLASCAYLTQNSADGHFDGLKSAILRKQNDKGVIRLLVVHGMGNHDSGYADPLMKILSADLGLVSQGASDSEDIRKDDFLYGVVRKENYLDGVGTLKLKLYELTWSPAVIGLKEQAFQFDGTLAKKRLLLNRDLKAGLLNQDLADAVLYTGKYRGHMQYPVMRAIQIIEHDGLGPGDELGIITHSLGSRMTFDTLNDMIEGIPIQLDGTPIPSEVDDNKRIATSVILHTKYFFMMANQLPLLALSDAEKPVGEKPTVRHHSMKKFLQLRSLLKVESGKRLEPANNNEPTLHMIAFSDPNDLLTYPIDKANVVDGNSTALEVEITNVRISVARWGWFFLVANPLTAHTGYFTDARTIHQIANGSK